MMFSGKNKKNIINLSSAENAQRVVKVKVTGYTFSGDNSVVIVFVAFPPFQKWVCLYFIRNIMSLQKVDLFKKERICFVREQFLAFLKWSTF